MSQVSSPRSIELSFSAPKTRLRVKILRVGLVLCALAAIALAARYYYGRRSKNPVRYQTAAVDSGRIAAKVTATGTLSALITVQVGSQVSGRIQSLLVDYNSKVKANQVIARIESSFFTATVEQARANLAAAKANLEQARAQQTLAERVFKRNQQLSEQNLIARSEFEAAESEVAVSKARVSAADASVQQASASLNQANINLKYTTIVSPIDGVVVSRTVDVGQTVAASLQAPTLFTIAQDLAQMQVHTNVAEGDIGKLRVGMPALFSVDAYPNQHFEGTIRQIRDAAQTVQNVVTYDAVIDVANPEHLLKPGMTANVTFVHADKPDVVRVPNAALRFRPESAVLALLNASNKNSAPAGSASGSRWGADNTKKMRRGAETPDGNMAPKPPRAQGSDRAVWLLEGTELRLVSVKTGITDGTWTELVGGQLNPGNLLVTEAILEGGSASAAPRRPF